MVLAVEGLVLQRRDGVHLLGPLDLTLGPGERLGLVGESGSGKSLLVQALFGALPPGVRQTAGRIRAFGVAMEQPGPARDRLRGARVAWVPQQPGQALNPLLTLAEHLALLPGIHHQESPRAVVTRLAPLLARLRLPADSAFLGRFPHQLSGGQQQRLCLAMALSCDPELLVLDEPTAALDASVRQEFLELVLELQRAKGLAFLWVTHDLTLAADVCDRLLVLYGGQRVEAGPAARVLGQPRHPYTARLLSASRREPSQEAAFLPAPQDRPEGCPFGPRCPRVQTSCGRWAPWRGIAGDGLRCQRPLAAGIGP